MIKISPFTPLFFSPSTDRYGEESRYIQTFSTDDSVVVQVLADAGETVTGTLQNVITGAATAMSFDVQVMSSGTTVYTCVLASQASGYYSVDVNGIESEIFHVTDNVSELQMTSLIRYTSYTNKLRSDVVFWNDTVQYEFQFRVPGGFKDGDWGFEVNNEQFETGDGNIVELYAIESTQKIFTMGNAMGCPVWFGDLLNRIMCCTHVHINDVRYVRKGNSTPEITQELPNLKSYIFRISLQGMVENVNIELPSSDDGDPESEGGGEGYIYLIKLNDTTRATDSNTYSALRMQYELENAMKKFDTDLSGKYLSKEKDDRTEYGLEAREYRTLDAVLSMLAGRGSLVQDGLIQTDRLEVRHSMTVMEIIFNRLSAMESNYAFSAAATIEEVNQLVDSEGNVYYRLTFRKRWENDFHAFAMNDIIYGQQNDLASGGRSYFTSWMRVLEFTDAAANQVDVTLWDDDQVPGGVNYAPEPMMNVIHRGNTSNTERQSYWFLSALDEKCLVWLEGVDAPILREENYYMILGKLKDLSVFSNLPINYSHSYMYARGAVVQDLFRVDFNGVAQKSENHRGLWSYEIASGENPYRSTDVSYDTVWHNGCKWQCLSDMTLETPSYASSDWAFREGNPAFEIDVTSTKGEVFHIEETALTDETGEYIPFTELVVTGKMYNEDVTQYILDENVVWTRDSGITSEDNEWAVLRANAGKTLSLTRDDLGSKYPDIKGMTFIATATIEDGVVAEPVAYIL